MLLLEDVTSAPFNLVNHDVDVPTEPALAGVLLVNMVGFTSLRLISHQFSLQIFD